MRLLLALTSPFLLAWCASLLWMILDGHKLRPKFLLIFGAHRCTKSKVHSCREVEQKNILKFLIHGFIFLDSHRFFIIKSQSREEKTNWQTFIFGLCIYFYFSNFDDCAMQCNFTLYWFMITFVTIVKFIYSEKATKFCEISTNYLYWQSNNWWRFHNILWPSQNIWTLSLELLT